MAIQASELRRLPPHAAIARNFYLRNTISEDKINILRQFGSEIELIENEELFQPDAIHRIIDRIKAENPDAFYTGQRSNDANPQVHFETTGPEIWRDTEGDIDILVATVGTGGTVSGAGRFLKAQKPEIRIVVAEPTPQSVPSPENPGASTIEGVHKVTEVEEGTLPETYDKSVVDEVIAVTTEEARRGSACGGQRGGLPCGNLIRCSHLCRDRAFPPRGKQRQDDCGRVSG
ncbi:pyridoxal-phosphate dependent enzyme [Agrobacterium sp. SORGH_AS_0440]|uniref:pyridoxal-phosphate dependent enzyme n=1 Tax=Agrobacterium sp. SORGH_AS_0440 TaxID=3041757 RepID=UPI0028649457|nr:pyridoxal-phosphate dependent enzyme [Agrobacterium sp. SORGH_AS_0440]MDR6079415.1 cysteine synthase [Agrobacterium sp. SORGH_AS_0440]